VSRYPLYSKSDQALWMLGTSGNPRRRRSSPLRTTRGSCAIILSPLVPGAKTRLKALGVPVPQPDPQAVAWMTAEQNAPRQHEAFIRKPLRIVQTGPGQSCKRLRDSGTNDDPESESEAELIF